MPGSALVWEMGAQRYESAREIVENRPGGLSLVVVLPEAEAIDADPSLIRAIHRCRPHGLLPKHEEPHPSDIAAVLSRPPIDLPIWTE